MNTRNSYNMYQTHKVYIQEDMIFSNLILENPSLLFLLQFFAIDEVINDDTIECICKKNNIKTSVFLIFANLYNGFSPNREDINFENIDVRTVIKFLKKTHIFYVNDKYPEVHKYIKLLYENQNRGTIEHIELFFNEYFNEVLEHLKYEEEVAFPYFFKLLGDESKVIDENFSVSQYREHHTDIETKLSDLKNLLIKHIALKGDFPIKRKIIKSLFELENDLTIHSMIEEHILLPLVDELEKKRNLG